MYIVRMHDVKLSARDLDMALTFFKLSKVQSAVFPILAKDQQYKRD